MGGNYDDYAENVESDVYAESAGRFESAECSPESVWTHVKCYEDAESLGAVCRDHLFHNGPQNPLTHFADDASGWHEKENQIFFAPLKYLTLT